MYETWNGLFGLRIPANLLIATGRHAFVSEVHEWLDENIEGIWKVYVNALADDEEVWIYFEIQEQATLFKLTWY